MALNLSLGGGQLKDFYGKCLGYQNVNNTLVNGLNVTRIQWVECITAN